METVQRGLGWQRLGVGFKLSLGNFVAMVLFFALVMLAVSWSVTRGLEQRTADGLVNGAQAVNGLLQASDADLRARTQHLGDAFDEELHGDLERGPATTLANGSTQPTLLLNGTPVNGDFSTVDRFTRLTGAVATVFARSDNGTDFVRVTTSLKTQQNQRAMGTLLDHASPAYRAVMDGERYVGFATLFGRNYMTSYTPLKNAQGQVVAIGFVGLDFTTYLTAIKDTLRRMRIGQDGYYYVVDARPGATQGTLVVHPSQEGQGLLHAADADGQAVIARMLEQDQGVLRYRGTLNGTAVGAGSGGDGLAPQGRPATGDAERMAAFVRFPGWNWLVVADLDESAYHAAVRTTLLELFGGGVLVVALLCLAWYALVRRLVGRPLQDVQQVAEALAQGDLAARLDSTRRDEVGRLIGAINRIGEGLGEVVRSVRANASEVARASAEIAEGNQALSSRTEHQASAVEETAASMQEMGATVTRNAEHAEQAQGLAGEARDVAESGGRAVNQVVDAMHAINDSATRIGDIVGLIDSIAFQTNILALNAGVEAARAGEQGRGFAVVAGEVRTLAQRSDTAAKEIKALVGTTVARIRSSNAQADDAGRTMAQVVARVQALADLMGGISDASQEQRAGVVQIDAAMQQMDETTQQNAALVEEMASSASSLAVQAEALVRTVAVFRGV